MKQTIRKHKNANIKIVSKELLLIAALIIVAITTQAQMQPMGMGAPQPQPWTTSLMTVPSGVSPDLGTQSNDPLNFYTNGQKRIEISPDGAVNISNLANPDNPGLQFLYVDGDGNVTTYRPLNTEGIMYCGDAVPWTLGGNNLPIHTNGNIFTNANVLGHCSDTNLVLEANAVKSLFLSSNGKVGVGKDNQNPTATLDISNPIYGEHLRIYGDNDGAIESTANMHLYFEPSSDFRISYGIQAGNAHTDMLKMNASTGILLNDNTTVAGNATIEGKTIIGTQTQTTGAHTNALLTVNGKIVGKEAVVTLSNWADYVFAKDYKLQSLENLEHYIKQNKHLPNVPTAKQIEENGADLGELVKVQMEKIEELTLYMIELKKELEALKSLKK